MDVWGRRMSPSEEGEVLLVDDVAAASGGVGDVEDDDLLAVAAAAAASPSSPVAEPPLAEPCRNLLANELSSPPPLLDPLDLLSSGGDDGEEGDAVSTMALPPST